jgi:iron complex outermembrane receptor protein
MRTDGELEDRMPKYALLALLAVSGLVESQLAVAQRAAQIAFEDPQPHFIAAWAPTQERAAERSAALARRVSLELSGESLDGALKALTRQAGLRLTYSPAVLPAERRVTIRASDVAVVTALTEMLFRSGLDVVVDRDGTMALVICRHFLEAQEQDSGAIVGRVTDKATGAAIVGATVVVEGTGRAATTDGEGRYHILRQPAGEHTVRARYIGYTPSSAVIVLKAGEDATADFALDKSVQQLDQVVVTGTIVPTQIKAVPNPISVVMSEQIQEEHLTRVDQIFRGTVPGSVAWEPGTNDYTSTISVRGRSSLFASPSIKTYIDGVEVSNPLYIATIDPNSVDRVEVTRGPQASTVYGSDASGGVMQIFTKRGSPTSRPRVTATALLGNVQGPYADASSLRQEYRAGLAGGREDATYSLSGSYIHTGPWAPGYFSKDPSISAGARLLQGALTMDFSGRYASKTFSYVYSPALSQFAFFDKPAYETDRIRQQTYGITLTYEPVSRWEHSFVLGFDRLSYGFLNTRPRLTTPSDTALQVSTANSSKPSLRYNTSYSLPLGRSVSAVATIGAEYYEFEYSSDYTPNATRTSGPIDGTTSTSKTQFSNKGYFTQVQVGVRDRLFLTAGLRAEHNDNFGEAYGTAWSPRFGVSYVHDLGGLSLKARTSFGNAIRGVDPLQKGALQNAFTDQVANTSLAPERQVGWDGGLELHGRAGFIGATYYDQTAKDLIDIVYLNSSSSPPVSQFQNVGEIKNKGWEFEGQVALGRVGLRGTYWRTSSRVRHLSPTYAGDLRVGDRLLDSPVSGAGAAVTWRPLNGTIGVVSIAHIGHWSGVDAQALYGAFFGGQPYRGTVRDYWIEYPSITKFDIAVSQRIARNVTALLQITNIGNNGRFEQSNISIPLGRVTTVGARLDY